LEGADLSSDGQGESLLGGSLRLTASHPLIR